MKTPFGNTVAAIKLAEMVQDNPRARRYVSSTLSELGKILREIQVGMGNPTGIILCRLVRDTFLDKVKQSEKISPETASFLKNVIVARCRNFQHYVVGT